MSQPIDAVLQRLDKPRQRASDQWSCRCPAHEDRSPSLSVKVLGDGRVLLHCFGGCDVETIVGALGLDLQDLFPAKPDAGHGSAPAKPRKLITAGQALDLLEREITLAAVCAADLARGAAIDEQTRERLLQGAARVAMLREEARA